MEFHTTDDLFAALQIPEIRKVILQTIDEKQNYRTELQELLQEKYTDLLSIADEANYMLHGVQALVQHIDQLRNKGKEVIIHQQSSSKDIPSVVGVPSSQPQTTTVPSSSSQTTITLSSVSLENWLNTVYDTIQTFLDRGDILRAVICLCYYYRWTLAVSNASSTSTTDGTSSTLNSSGIFSFSQSSTNPLSSSSSSTESKSSTFVILYQQLREQLLHYIGQRISYCLYSSITYYTGIDNNNTSTTTTNNNNHPSSDSLPHTKKNKNRNGNHNNNELSKTVDDGEEEEEQSSTTDGGSSTTYKRLSTVMNKRLKEHLSPIQEITMCIQSFILLQGYQEYTVQRSQPIVPESSSSSSFATFMVTYTEQSYSLATDYLLLRPVQQFLYACLDYQDRTNDNGTSNTSTASSTTPSLTLPYLTEVQKGSVLQKLVHIAALIHVTFGCYKLLRNSITTVSTVKNSTSSNNGTNSTGSIPSNSFTHLIQSIDSFVSYSSPSTPSTDTSIMTPLALVPVPYWQIYILLNKLNNGNETFLLSVPYIHYYGWWYAQGTTEKNTDTSISLTSSTLSSLQSLYQSWWSPLVSIIHSSVQSLITIHLGLTFSTTTTPTSSTDPELQAVLSSSSTKATTTTVNSLRYTSSDALSAISLLQSSLALVCQSMENDNPEDTMTNYGNNNTDDDTLNKNNNTLSFAVSESSFINNWNYFTNSSSNTDSSLVTTTSSTTLSSLLFTPPLQFLTNICIRATFQETLTALFQRFTVTIDTIGEAATVGALHTYTQADYYTDTTTSPGIDNNSSSPTILTTIDDKKRFVKESIKASHEKFKTFLELRKNNEPVIPLLDTMVNNVTKTSEQTGHIHLLQEIHTNLHRTVLPELWSLLPLNAATVSVLVAAGLVYITPTSNELRLSPIAVQIFTSSSLLHRNQLETFMQRFPSTVGSLLDGRIWQEISTNSQWRHVFGMAMDLSSVYFTVSLLHAIHEYTEATKDQSLSTPSAEVTENSKEFLTHFFKQIISTAQMYIERCQSITKEYEQGYRRTNTKDMSMSVSKGLPTLLKTAYSTLYIGYVCNLLSFMMLENTNTNTASSSTGSKSTTTTNSSSTVSPLTLLLKGNNSDTINAQSFQTLSIQCSNQWSHLLTLHAIECVQYTYTKDGIPVFPYSPSPSVYRCTENMNTLNQRNDQWKTEHGNWMNIYVDTNMNSSNNNNNSSNGTSNNGSTSTSSSAQISVPVGPSLGLVHTLSRLAIHVQITGLLDSPFIGENNRSSFSSSTSSNNENSNTFVYNFETGMTAPFSYDTDPIRVPLPFSISSNGSSNTTTTNGTVSGNDYIELDIWGQPTVKTIPSSSSSSSTAVSTLYTNFEPHSIANHIRRYRLFTQTCTSALLAGYLNTIYDQLYTTLISSSSSSSSLSTTVCGVEAPILQILVDIFVYGHSLPELSLQQQTGPSDGSGTKDNVWDTLVNQLKGNTNSTKSTWELASLILSKNNSSMNTPSTTNNITGTSNPSQLYQKFRSLLDPIEWQLREPYIALYGTSALRAHALAWYPAYPSLGPQNVSSNLLLSYNAKSVNATASAGSNMNVTKNQPSWSLASVISSSSSGTNNPSASTLLTAASVVRPPSIPSSGSANTTSTVTNLPVYATKVLVNGGISVSGSNAVISLSLPLPATVVTADLEPSAVPLLPLKLPFTRLPLLPTPVLSNRTVSQLSSLPSSALLNLMANGTADIPFVRYDNTMLSNGSSSHTNSSKQSSNLLPSTNTGNPTNTHKGGINDDNSSDSLPSTNTSASSLASPLSPSLLSLLSPVSKKRYHQLNMSGIIAEYRDNVENNGTKDDDGTIPEENNKNNRNGGTMFSPNRNGTTSSRRSMVNGSIRKNHIKGSPWFDTSLNDDSTEGNDDDNDGLPNHNPSVSGGISSTNTILSSASASALVPDSLQTLTNGMLNNTVKYITTSVSSPATAALFGLSNRLTSSLSLFTGNSNNDGSMDIMDSSSNNNGTNDQANGDGNTNTNSNLASQTRTSGLSSYLDMIL